MMNENQPSFDANNKVLIDELAQAIYEQNEEEKLIQEIQQLDKDINQNQQNMQERREKAPVAVAKESVKQVQQRAAPQQKATGADPFTFRPSEVV